MFDIVIPLGPNDTEFITKQIEKTRQNVIGYRNIYIITPISDFYCEHCIIINENIFPFAEEIAIYHGKNSRNGWYLQQLIKLYAGSIVPGILGRYLVIDADTFFLNPTAFENGDNCLYNFGREYHQFYFDHMKRLNPAFRRVYELSGICHHMIFEQSILEELFNRVSTEKPFWMVFLEEVDSWLRHGIGSGASEYELYFNYVSQFHSDKIEVRELQWENVKMLDFKKYAHLDYISYHHFMRE
jgi:hypothetical protein